ncbi:cytochrome P450 2A9 [Parasteatoda tepidariorum]|uniref:cytochrome P450 2A9 n=1 Tax=Parasteatoda tepidariorum TaxID=114398 RepID=UPI00077FAE36|nr:cytochrome P450 2A9 [Parasteatoda tepidariorum]
MLLNIEELANSATSIYVAVAVVLLSILYYLFKTRGLPPGPISYPYLGLWPILKHETAHLQLQEYAKKYGDVFSFTYTGRLFIHLGNVKATREAHITRSDSFYDRPNAFHLLNYFLDGGVVYLQGEAWKAVRKFLLFQFRERGMTAIKESLSGPIYDTVRETIADLRKAKGQPVDIAEILLVKCGKVMRQTLFGNDGMSDKEMIEFSRAYFKNLMSMTSINLMLVGNFAKYFLFPFAMNVPESKKGHREMKKIMIEVVKRRRATFDENHIRDGLDAFFKEKKEREARKDPVAKYFTDEVLMISLLQIVGDGVLFLAMFISDFLTAALKHPEEQEKIYKELVEVVGLDRNPEIDDKSKLIYTNAFLNEVMRTTETFTMFPSMECAKETTISGYRIPKGAITVYNFYAAHMNADDYDEPEKFKPSRFIAKEGQKKPDLLPLFGIGKRACMGEGYSMIQTFLFLTTILKNFRLTKAPTKKEDGTSLFFYFDKVEICAHPRIS